MKKILFLLITAIAVYSCSSSSDEEVKRAQLQKYKQEQYELTQKIEALENELAATEVEEVVSVKVMDINAQQFEHFIEIPADVEAVDNIDVSPESAGVIEDIYVSEGQQVSAGTVLASLRTEALQRSLDQLKIQLDLAVTNYERQKNLWDQNIGSEMQYLQAKTNMESLEKQIEALEAQIDMSEIKAPVDGVVDIIYQEEGEIGSPQVPFAKVVNIGRIKIYADVSEKYLTKIKTGDKVNVSFPAINKEIETTIQQIGNVIDENNRTFRIRLDVANNDKMIKPNLVSIVKVRDYISENAIVVPSLLIREDFNGEYTYIAENEGTKNVAKKIYVTSGVSNNNMIEITQGLIDGMKIISEGYNQVANGTSIQF